MPSSTRSIVEGDFAATSEQLIAIYSFDDADDRHHHTGDLPQATVTTKESKIENVQSTAFDGKTRERAFN